MAARSKVYVDVTTKTESSNKSLAKYAIAAGAAAVAIAGLVKVGKELIDAYKVQEQAETNLASAIIATGKETTISMDAMKIYASSLQDVTMFGDEAVLSGQALLQSLADLDQDGLQSVTPAVLDFATAMGVDVKTAMSLVGKTIGSSTNALTRYGIEIDTAGTKEEKLAAVTEALESKFGGMAEAAADTATGSITQLSNTMGDLKEAYGRNIAEGINPFVKALEDVVGQMVEGANKAHDLKDALNIVDEGGLTSAAQTLLILESQRDKLGAIAASYEMMDENANIAWENAKRNVEDYNESLSMTDSFLIKASDSETRRANAIQANSDAIKEYAGILLAARSEEEVRLDQLQEEIDKLVLAKAEAKSYGTEWSGVETLLVTLLAEKNELLKEEPELIEAVTEAAVTGYNDRSLGLEGVQDALINYRNREKTIIEESKIDWENLANSSMSSFASAFKQIGEEGVSAWDVLKQAGKDAMSSVLEGLAQEALARAALALASFNFIGAAGFTVAAAAAYAGSGLVQNLATGGSFVANQATPIMVGEGGGSERVTVEPIGGGDSGGSQTMILSIDGQQFSGWLQNKINNGNIRIPRRVIV